jgi:hypothetical protein
MAFPSTALVEKATICSPYKARLPPMKIAQGARLLLPHRILTGQMSQFGAIGGRA